MTTTTALTTIEQIKAANAAAGLFFFSPDTMRFFASRVLSSVFPAADGTAFFVTSEKACFDDLTRVFTVRQATPDGRVQGMGEFGKFPTARAAVAAAKGAARQAG